MAEDDTGSIFSLRVIASAVTAYWLAFTIYSFLSAPRLPTSIPWLGYGKGWIAGLRNFFAVTQAKDWVMEGYKKYSKNNKLFVLPCTMGMTAEVVVPGSQLSWMIEQPDSVLSTKDAHYDFLLGDYCFVEPIILGDPYHEHVIHRNLVRNINPIIPDLEEEVPEAVKDIYGTDTEKFHTVEVLDSFMRMVPRLTNRMLVGPKLAREHKYLEAVLSFTMDIIRAQTILFLFPKAFRPVFGNLLGLPSKYHYWLSSRFTLPLIRQRIEDIKKKDAGDPEYKTWKEPHDYITWHYRTACADGRVDEAQPARIAKRIMPLNFASIHTTSLTAYETLTYILSSDPDAIESLREEADRILREEGGWTKQGLSRMHRMDSAIRESQRASPIAQTFVQRKVVAKEGVVSPGGVRFKYGTILSLPWAPLAQDDDIHENATKFDPFRYSRPREEYEKMSPEEKEKTNALKLKQTGIVTSSIHHLPFGHGRHACPGRFFVAHELKMIFAYLLLNYDFKPVTDKPEKTWVIRFQVPKPVKIEFRRRKEAWQPGHA